MIIRTCASSANLGPGFDCFGIAWQLYNDIEFLPGGDGLSIAGCDRAYANADNLAYRAFLSVLKAAGIAPEPLQIRFLDTDIPVSRGLGSSAALITGGICAANELYSLALSRAELLKLATALEGHPDNVAPALFGGLSVSAMDGGRVVTRSFSLSGRLHFAAIVPDFELSTSLARSVLPSELPRQDAVFNVSRAALLLKALETGDEELMSFTLADRLHQPYRRALIPGYETAEALAKACGACGVCISGAGSTMLCASESEDTAAKLSSALPASLPGWRVLPLLPDMQGARVI